MIAVVGQVGFIERENASILNASIMSFALHTISGFQRAMKRLGLACPLYLTQVGLFTFLTVYSYSFDRMTEL